MARDQCRTASGPTGLPDNDAARRPLADYHENFRACWRQRPAGFVVGHDDRIVAAELFADTELFANLRDKLFVSYALDHLCRWPAGDLDVRRNGIRRPGLDAEDIRRFLSQVEDARLTYLATPGDGERVGIVGPAVEGTALVSRGIAVHVNLYPAGRIYRE